MKQAFSLLELVFCIVILSFVFGFYYFIFLNSPQKIIKFNQQLFEEEKELLKKNNSYKKRDIVVNGYILLEYSSNKFNIKSLQAKDLTYINAFGNEKNF
ncbi:hypothetical protein [Campylobacter sp. RM16704]|uniref:hypothetical protein n=1 Tax=Campylobacter sp. RM16704 TaxID=1500960 RepID=UPI00057F6412|nr:hypothetical protein [Campylobacter sp. RM16704]AJC86403.1 hypothetical protein CAQ16704_0946 [Campylobacter sp. RM16704]